MPNEIDALIKERKSQVKPKRNQTVYGVVIVAIVWLVCALFWNKYYRYAVCLGVGTLIGIILRYSRFCFTAAFRDPFVSGSTRIFRGVLLAMIVSTVGFAIIQSQYSHQKGINYDLIPGAVSSVGMHVVIGAFIFGIGMVLAGGCASSVLVRMGEGHTLYGVVFLGFIIGALLGAKDYAFWYNIFIKDAKTIYFLEYMDFKWVIAIQITVLLLLYKLALSYENKHFTK